MNSWLFVSGGMLIMLGILPLIHPEQTLMNLLYFAIFLLGLWRMADSFKE